jgi:hypothetical protein
MSITSILTQISCIHAIDHITINGTFTLAHKLSVKEPLPSDWLALASPNWTASVEKALEGDTVLIMPANGADKQVCRRPPGPLWADREVRLSRGSPAAISRLKTDNRPSQMAVVFAGRK